MGTLFLCLFKHIHGLTETGLWLVFYYLGKRDYDFTILAVRVNDFTIWWIEEMKLLIAAYIVALIIILAKKNDQRS